MIAIRVNGNEMIGMGHTMRCFSIGKALKNLGYDPIIITSDQAVVELSIINAFPYVLLDSTYENLDKEICQIRGIIKDKQIEKIILDSYSVTEKYMERIKCIAKLIYLDDLFKFNYPADYVVNYNINSESLGYEKQYESERLIIGCRYVPLREEFQNVEPVRIKDKVENVLITTGATDKYGICYKIAQYLSETDKYTNIKYHIVVGKFFENVEELENLEGRYPNVILHKNVLKMTEVMKECDVAISAGGSTMYELCVHGLPIITFSFVENQEVVVQEFSKKEAALSLNNWNQNSLEKLSMYFAELVSNINLRKELARKSRVITDGKGAIRLAQKIIDI